MALILVLGSLVIMTVLATEMFQSTSATLSASMSERDAIRAEYHARSAVNLSRLLIATEPMVRKAVEPMFRALMKSSPPQIPVWKFTDLVLGPFNCPENAAKFNQVAAPTDTGKSMGSSGCFNVQIIDEDSKINLNAAITGDAFSQERLGHGLLGLIGPPQYTELFEKEDQDGQFSNQSTICGALIDWTDQDELMFPCNPESEGRKGSESPEDNYYQSIGLPYARKNAAFDSLEEVHLVRGISDDFWANFVEPNPQNPDERVLTVWGQGDKINVNTANAQTILAIVCAGAPDAPPCVDPEQTSTFLMALTLGRQIAQGAPLFKSPKAFVRAMSGKGKGIGPLFSFFGVEPIEFKKPRQVEKVVTTESRVFSIYAEGLVASRTREAHVFSHTVVDFRSANELGASAASAEGDSGTGDGTDKASPASAPSGSLPSPEEVARALASDPMGVIIYHRLE